MPGFPGLPTLDPRLAAEWGQSCLIRGAISVPLALGVTPSTNAARALGAWFATSRINRKRFPRALANLREAFPDASDERLHALGVAAYQHLFQLGIEICFAPRLITEEGWARHLDMAEIAPSLTTMLGNDPCVLITGHCGNWELIGYAVAMLGFPMWAVYRPLDLRPLDAWLRQTRQRRGLTLVSKFGAMRTLPAALDRRVAVGLVADQSGGDRGMFVPFFGRLTSTYKSIGLLAMQTRARVVCGMARRMPPGASASTPLASQSLAPGPRDSGPASMRYAIETVDVFGPEDWDAQPDPLFYITARYRRAIEAMVRSAPEQYLWMHRIWRARPGHERHNKPFPASLRAKLEALPWMTQGELDRILARSARDTRDLVAGVTPL
jgi:KDO2-lipid IV(A) lauroyltransferase